ncbi:MAG: hypothetical protein HYZ74_01855 [Elusimicrobia bacterium]|nr:hypothetical protein [Elusimicrobiota bacterium]
MNPEEKAGSLFASLRGFSDAPAPAAPPPSASPPRPEPAPAPFAPPSEGMSVLLERLARLEARGAEASGAAAAEARIAGLEKRLQEAQERAIASQIMLREREEAQKAAQRESESTLQAVNSQRRMDELDRQMKGNIESQRRRIEELEGKLLEASSSKTVSETAAAQKLIGEQLAQAQAELAWLKNALAALIEDRRVAAAEAQALRVELRYLKEAHDEGAKSRAAAAIEAEATRKELELLKSELTLVQRAVAQGEGVQRSAAKEAEDLRGELVRVNALAVGAEEAHVMAQAQMDETKARIEAADASARKEAARLAQNVEELREEMRRAAASHRASQISESAQREKTYRIMAESIEALKRKLDEMDAAAGDRLSQLQQSVERVQDESSGAQLDPLRAALDEKLKIAAERMSRFETEMRSLVLSRVLKLEEEARRMKKENE